MSRCSPIGGRIRVQLCVGSAGPQIGKKLLAGSQLACRHMLLLGNQGREIGFRRSVCDGRPAPIARPPDPRHERPTSRHPVHRATHRRPRSLRRRASRTRHPQRPAFPRPAMLPRNPCTRPQAQFRKDPMSVHGGSSGRYPNRADPARLTKQAATLPPWFAGSELAVAAALRPGPC